MTGGVGDMGGAPHISDERDLSGTSGLRPMVERSRERHDRGEERVRMSLSHDLVREEYMMIVVGIDQSEGAKAALRFALDEARLRQVPLRAVHAWEFGVIGNAGFEGSLPVSGGDLIDFRRAAEAGLESVLNDVVGDTEGVEIRRSAVQGTAAAVLVHESRGADMLVVGSRGHGGFAQLLLGSVSQQCAHHAECPVVIVRRAAAGP